MSKILNGIGHVYTTRVKDSINCGKGVFDPNKIKWIEDENGKVLVGNSRVRVIGNGSTTIVPPEPPAQDEVTIGDQTWKNAYIEIDDGGEGIKKVENVTINDVNFGTIFYYTWDAYQRIKSIIPSGWHVPTSLEASSFISAVTDIPSICTESGWNGGLTGTNTTGFNAIPVGFYPSSPSVAGGGIGSFCMVDYSNPGVYSVLETGIDGSSLSRLRLTMSPLAGYTPIRLIKDS